MKAGKGTKDGLTVQQIRSTLKEHLDSYSEEWIQEDIGFLSSSKEAQLKFTPQTRMQVKQTRNHVS